MRTACTYYDIAVPQTVIALGKHMETNVYQWSVESMPVQILQYMIFIACLLCYRVQTITCKKILKILRLHTSALNVYLLRIENETVMHIQGKSLSLD